MALMLRFNPCCPLGHNKQGDEMMQWLAYMLVALVFSLLPLMAKAADAAMLQVP